MRRNQHFNDLFLMMPQQFHFFSVSPDG
jgi:hypothetical protein